ncbi:hypothetical protein [Streptomyces minutiscleroticus]|uniref:Uncharacterized protein n=1 Tax=Streptomyces minutiscleroticus TaxID=68238 RepID=A0A918U897_9ACTN|nr:hypothetical protein [Streptomyces minutiscleroticus]GGY08109.1 hypothetical protein GCM10010358_71520 [Streptomyces minutiscleroticus]
MTIAEQKVQDVADVNIDIEAELSPPEADGVFRDSRQCAALALAGGSGSVLLSPPTPRPKKS